MSDEKDLRGFYHMRMFSVLALVLLAQAAQAASATRPNVLFILADDLGSESSALYPALYDDKAPAALGQAPTPTLSALASRGVVFDTVWSSPNCSPARAAVLSGLYGHNTGVTTVFNILPGSTVSIFELLASSSSPRGRNMAVFGKWHLAGHRADGMTHVVKETGVPLFRGFMDSHISNYYDWTVENSDGEPLHTNVYSTTALTDYAIDFIRGQKSNEPWFVYLPYNAPHGTSPNDGFQVPPANLFTVDVGGRPAGSPVVYNGVVPVFQSVIQALDTEIGRLLRAMDEAGQLKNTVIIFMGDNGTPKSVKDSASRIRGSKETIYEGGVRVPLVIAGPGVTRTGREPHLVSGPDLYATIAQLSGVPLKNNTIYNSYSLVPLLSNAHATTGRKYSFTEMCANNGAGVKRFAIRDDRYKLLYNGTAWELFDLQADPWETSNLYDDPKIAKSRSVLMGQVTELKKQATTKGCFVDIPT